MSKNQVNLIDKSWTAPEQGQERKRQNGTPRNLHKQLVPVHC